MRTRTARKAFCTSLRWLIALSGSAAPAAYAADWQAISVTSSVTVSIDHASFAVRGKHPSVWVKMDWASSQKSGLNEFPAYQTKVQLFMANCGEGTYSTSQFTLYASAGMTGDSRSFNIPQDFEYPLPDSIALGVMQAICRRYPVK